MTDLDAADRAILNAYQGGFPVVADPYEPAAAALREHEVDVTAADLLERVVRLDEAGVLSRFGALVNAEAIGGTATLVAMHAPEDRFDEVAERVNAHPEVAHNYEREHPHLNMWFVLSVADESRVSAVLADIEAETGQTTYNLPKEREFHVEATFPVEGPLADLDGGIDLSDLGPDGHVDGGSSGAAGAADAPGAAGAADAAGPSTAGPQADGPKVGEAADRAGGGRDGARLAPAERDLVVEIQDGLPLSRTPYRDVADALDRDVGWVLRTLDRFLGEGKVRRVGLVPNHYALGYTENGMTVWDVPDDRVDEVGPAVASLDFVTHCYRRPRHEGVWPYNVFAMTHGRSEAESDARIRQVRDVMAEHWDVGPEDWDTLFSTRILKKTGIRLEARADANTA